MPYCGDLTSLWLLVPVSMADMYSSSSSFESELILGRSCIAGAIEAGREVTVLDSAAFVGNEVEASSLEDEVTGSA